MTIRVFKEGDCMTLLAVSFHGTHMNSQRFLWKQNTLLSSSGSDGAPPVMDQEGCQPYIGGMFVLYDWERDQVVWQIEVDGAMGYCWHQERLYINLLRFGEILVLDGDGREVQRISHPAFNDLHSIVPTRRGFLLTSTGIDSIIEIDHKGELIYEWSALEHGYHLLGNRQPRNLDRSLDHRYMLYPTSSHTIHVNSARFADAEEEVILATFFVQGTIVAIHRQSGQAEIVVRGLSRPHDVRPYMDGCWIVSDTTNNQALILDKDWRIVRRIAQDFDWVQSSAPLPDGSIVLADSNHHRLVRAYPHEEYEIRAFPPDWRVYLVDAVPDEYATVFQSALP